MTPRILLIISGGIAAYKSLELVRLLRKRGMTVRAVLTQSAHPTTSAPAGVVRAFGAATGLPVSAPIGYLYLVACSGRSAPTTARSSS